MSGFCLGVAWTLLGVAIGATVRWHARGRARYPCRWLPGGSRKR